MQKMIECKNVVYKYSTGEEGIEKLAIDGLNLDVNKGEFLVVLGHNGSGKSFGFRIAGKSGISCSKDYREQRQNH